MRELEDLRGWKKQQMKPLLELVDLTEQLDRAVNRKDQVSVKMLVAMRQDPVEQARELEDRVREYILTLPEETAIRMQELLDGGAAETPEEKALAEQVAQNRRLLKRILEVDKATSLKLGGSHSFYRMFRD